MQKEYGLNISKLMQSVTLGKLYTLWTIDNDIFGANHVSYGKLCKVKLLKFVVSSSIVKRGQLQKKFK